MKRYVLLLLTLLNVNSFSGVGIMTGYGHGAMLGLRFSPSAKIAIIPELGFSYTSNSEVGRTFELPIALSINPYLFNRDKFSAYLKMRCGASLLIQKHDKHDTDSMLGFGLDGQIGFGLQYDFNKTVSVFTDFGPRLDYYVYSDHATGNGQIFISPSAGVIINFK